jgi:hypothetical protein
MKNKFLLIFFIFSSLSHFLSNAQQLQYAVSIGGTKGEDAAAMIQTNDGGFITVGSTSSFGAGKTNIYIVKLKTQPSGVYFYRVLSGGNGLFGEGKIII